MIRPGYRFVGIEDGGVYLVATFELTHGDGRLERRAVPLSFNGKERAMGVRDIEEPTGDRVLDDELTAVACEWLAAIRSVTAVAEYDDRRADLARHSRWAA